MHILRLRGTDGKWKTVTALAGAKGDKGEPGADGTDGTDGVSPEVAVADITGGHRVTITDAAGAHTFDVMDGSGSAGWTQKSVGTSKTLDSSYANSYIDTWNSESITITLPGGNVMPLGTEIIIFRYNTGSVTIAPGSAAIRDSSSGELLSGGFSIENRYAAVRLLYVETNLWIAFR